MTDPRDIHDDEKLALHDMSVRAHNVVMNEMAYLGICAWEDRGDATVGMLREMVSRVGGLAGVLRIPGVGKITAREIMALVPPPVLPMTGREMELSNLAGAMIRALEARAICARKYHMELRRITG